MSDDSLTGSAEPPVKLTLRLNLLKVMGPGLITAASDDDPSGIATYSQAGAQFGYAIGWSMLFSYPLAFSNLAPFSIIFTTAATLNAHGIKNITTSSQAALALKPIAGPFAFTVFAIGIIGTGLLAVPVLAGSAAYVVGEAFKWPVGLALKAKRAKAFYATIIVAFSLGALLNFSPLDPIKALFWSAVVNGVVAVPVMVMIPSARISSSWEILCWGLG